LGGNCKEHKKTILRTANPLIMYPPKRSEWTNPMTAPVDRFVHKMGCVFHLPLHPTLTNILPRSIVLASDLRPFFFRVKFFPTLTLHTTLPPNYSITYLLYWPTS
jgi:hypothetical protein